MKLEVIGLDVVSVIPDGVALPPLGSFIVSGSTNQPVVSMGPVTPLSVAWQLENFTVPKLANGRTPPNDDGASTIHSPEVLIPAEEVV